MVVIDAVLNNRRQDCCQFLILFFLSLPLYFSQFQFIKKKRKEEEEDGSLHSSDKKREKKYF